MAFWVTLMRALFALILGVGLLLQPGKTLPLLGNFMGVFWLMTGIVSLRWGVRGEKAQGTAVIAGGIGVFAGLVYKRPLMLFWPNKKIKFIRPSKLTEAEFY